MDDDDFQNLYVYDVKLGTLQKIKQDDAMIILNVSQNEKTKLITVRYAVDRNKNGNFEYAYEPIAYKIFDIQTMAFKNIIPPNQIKELQELLEGK